MSTERPELTVLGRSLCVAGALMAIAGAEIRIDPPHEVVREVTEADVKRENMVDVPWSNADVDFVLTVSFGGAFFAAGEVLGRRRIN